MSTPDRIGETVTAECPFFGERCTEEDEVGFATHHYLDQHLLGITYPLAHSPTPFADEVPLRGRAS